MQSQDYIKFIEDLSIVKDINLKSKMIKDEIKKLNVMMKEIDYSELPSRIEKVQKQSEYLELETYKNVLSFRLSWLQTHNELE